MWTRRSTESKRSTASDIATAKPKPPARRGGGIAGLILLANLAGLAVLISGALVLNELRAGLVQAKIDALRAQGATIVSVLAEAATEGDPEPALVEGRARLVLQQLYVPPDARVRLYSIDRRLVADSQLLYDQVQVRPLPPIAQRAPEGDRFSGFFAEVRRGLALLRGAPTPGDLSSDITDGLSGRVVAAQRLAPDGARLVSVTLPVQRVQAVVGVLTLESKDVDAIIQAERVALAPFILVAMGVAIASSGLLTWSIARPLRRLAQAADDVRVGRERVLDLPNLSSRSDELGELAGSLESMTAALVERSDSNERFAADVAHEIKNPLASIRNAVDLLPRASDAAMRAKLEQVIASDVKRLDRLVTDISNASRVDAQLARDRLEPVSLAQLCTDIAEAYRQLAGERGVSVELRGAQGDALSVLGREEALSRVLRNLIDNALSFSESGARVIISADRVSPGRVRISVSDEGPGIPPENLESVFERFYTHRPRAHGFGVHSGLGLSIARQIALAHKGRLWAENRAEGGARFTLELPARS
jgi:two-component system, OmpR family, sensor histidine kinase ChvG